jgi:hypothetical protein
MPPRPPGWFERLILEAQTRLEAYSRRVGVPEAASFAIETAWERIKAIPTGAPSGSESNVDRRLRKLLAHETVPTDAADELFSILRLLAWRFVADDRRRMIRQRLLEGQAGFLEYSAPGLAARGESPERQADVRRLLGRTIEVMDSMSDLDLELLMRSAIAEGDRSLDLSAKERVRLHRLRSKLKRAVLGEDSADAHTPSTTRPHK